MRRLQQEVKHTKPQQRSSNALSNFLRAVSNPNLLLVVLIVLLCEWSQKPEELVIVACSPR